MDLGEVKEVSYTDNNVYTVWSNGYSAATLVMSLKMLSDVSSYENECRQFGVTGRDLS